MPTLMIVEIHPIVNCCNQFRFRREYVPVVVLVLERRPQRFRSGVIPTDPSGAHRAAQPVLPTGDRHVVGGVLTRSECRITPFAWPPRRTPPAPRRR